MVGKWSSDALGKYLIDPNDLINATLLQGIDDRWDRNTDRLLYDSCIDGFEMIVVKTKW